MLVALPLVNTVLQKPQIKGNSFEEQTDTLPRWVFELHNQFVHNYPSSKAKMYVNSWSCLFCMFYHCVKCTSYLLVEFLISPDPGMIPLLRAARRLRKNYTFFIQWCELSWILAIQHFLHCSWLTFQVAGKTPCMQHYTFRMNTYLRHFTWRFAQVSFGFFHCRASGPVDCENLKNKVVVECERIEERIMNTWFPKVIHLLTSKEMLQGVRAEKLDSFYACVSTLISNQVR